jgi:hypothetical protein
MANDTQKGITIGVTGHRLLTQKQLATLEPVIKKAIDNIIYYHKNSYNSTAKPIFISAIAVGADTVFANIALKHFDGDLKVYLPFEIEEYVDDFTSQEDLHAFNQLLLNPKIKEVRSLYKLADDTRDDLYLNTGKQIVNESDYIIAVWNEEQARGKGGTGDIVEYSVAMGKNLLVINPYDKNLIIKANYLPHLSHHLADQPRPDLLSHNLVEDHFSLFDKAAVLNQRAYKHIWQSCFRIGWLGAALILSIKVVYALPENTQFILTVLEIICLAIIILLIRKEKKEEYHKKYLQYRFIAERLRINNLLYVCGYYPIRTETKVIHKAMQEIESKYPVGMINKIIQLTSYSGDSFDEKKERVKHFALGQGKYHEKRKHSFEKQYNRNYRIKIACLVSFAAIIILHIVHEFSLHELRDIDLAGLFHLTAREPDTWNDLSFLLYLFIPTTLARFEAIKYLNDWERLITQSTYMSGFFFEIAEKLTKTTNEDELNKLLVDLNDNIYLENLDWEMFMVNKNEEII